MIARDMAADAPIREPLLSRSVRWTLAVVVMSMPLYAVRWHIGPLPTTLLEIVILIAVALYAFEVWRHKAQLPKRTPYDIPIALFLVAGLIGVFVAPEHRGALGVFRAYLLEPIAVYYVATAVLGTADAVALLLAAWGVGAAVLGIVEIATFRQALLSGTLHIGNATAALDINPNSVAFYLEPLIGLAAGFALFGRGLHRWVGLAVLSLLVVAEVTTLSRGGLFALAALTVIAVLTVRSTLVRLALVGASLVGVIAVWQWPVVGLRITYFLLKPTRYLLIRVHIWEATLRMLRDHPVFGAGLNAYQSTMAPYRAASAYPFPEPYPHNIALTAWTEVGLLGLVAFMYLLVALAVRPWMALKRSSGLYRPLLWGLGSAFVMIFVHGLVDSPYWKNDLSVEFWVLAAMEVVAIRAVNAMPVERD
jgi:putative inorganic carbon (hco3(-)) transporter